MKRRSSSTSTLPPEARHCRRSALSAGILLALGTTVTLGAEPDPSLEEIMITGSRIRVTSGMETPNPVTVVTPDQIALTAPGSIIDGLAELPQFSGSQTTANAGNFFNNPTTGSLSLRGLQGKRTLTLLSGRRVVSANLNSGPDINLFPENLLRSVETVTGGATAAYGTDAVSGAVNFILDTGFTGYKGGVQYGENYNGDNGNYEVSMAGGWDIGERFHLLLSAEKYDQDPVFGYDGYDWYDASGLLSNSAAGAGETPNNPLRIAHKDVISRTASYDGVITFTPAALGVWTVSPTGVATPFVLGSASDANFHTVTNGGSGTDNGTYSTPSQIQMHTARESYFAYLDYDVNDSLTVYGQLIQGYQDYVSVGSGGLFGGQRAFTIFSGNPFLPANIQALMTANNVPSVRVGRIGHPSDISNVTQGTDTDMRSMTAGFDLDLNAGFLDGWQLTGYAQKGLLDNDISHNDGIRIDRIYLAADAVRDASGKIVCNVTRVSGRYPDCVPFNVFGRGLASKEAIDWVTGFDPGVQVNTVGYLPEGGIPYSYIGGTAKKRLLEMEQDVFELNANGELFEGFGAGPISMALGYAWRSESFVQLVQASQGNPSTSPNVFPVAANNAAQGIRGVPGPDSSNSVEIQFSKVGFGVGDFRVREAFTEFRVPLLSDMAFIDQLDSSFAARWANYEGSGDVWSWKGGFEWAINQELRLRGTVSQDVRAATMGERYDRSGGVAPITDYLEDPNGATTSNYSVTIVQGGNPTVKPEEAKTVTAGVVYQPQWLEGLQLAVDWYDVEIADNINLLGAATVVTNCYRANDVDACALIERDGVPSTIKPGLNRISLVNDVYINVNSVAAKGVDFEASYRRDFELFGGAESGVVRLIGSQLLENTSTNSAGVVRHNEEQFGLPEWNLQLSGTYIRNDLSVNLQARYESSTVQSTLNNVYQETLGRVRWDVAPDVNAVDSQVLLDARIGYRFELAGTSLNAFVAINNVLNEDPIVSIAAPDAALSQAVNNGHVGSLLGRRYTVGVNFDF